MTLTAQKLIEYVDAENNTGWKNSDIPREHENMFRHIANHFKNCNECAEEFDAQDYENITLQDFADRYFWGSKLNDWICANR